MPHTLLLPAAASLVSTSASIYGFGFLNAEISPWRSIWKTMPVASMAVFAAFLGVPSALVAALVLSAVGDYFLSRDERRFTIGLASFLSAHLIYIWIFWQLGGRFSPGWGHAAMVGYGLVFGAYLWPRAGAFRGPVIAYIFVITAMVGFALFLPAGWLMLVLGTFAFAFSDSVLALEMFVIKDPKTKAKLSKVVWVTYILAQSLIVLGILNSL